MAVKKKGKTLMEVFTAEDKKKAVKAKPAMHNYVYIAAYLDAPDEDAILAFEHVFIKAKDAEDAYYRGFDKLTSKHPSGYFKRGIANDYVVRLPKE